MTLARRSAPLGFRASLPLLLLLVLAVMPAMSSPMRYDLVFTADSGIAPVAGSFTYDPLNRTGGQPIQDFTIYWQEMSFDFTDSINTFGLLQEGFCSGGR